MDYEPLTHISKIQDLIDCVEFCRDDDLQDAIDTALRLIVEQPEKIQSVGRLIIRFQAWSLKFAMLASTYTTIKKSPAGADNNYKKNLFYTAADQCDKMAQSLKYLAREVR